MFAKLFHRVGLAVLFLLAGFSENGFVPPNSVASPPVASGPGKYADSELLVDTGWLANNLTGSSLRILDVRSAEKFRAEHIPNAVSAPLEEVAVTPDPNKAVTHELLPKQQMENWLGSLGISNTARIVLYDEGGSTWATRLFWTLEYYGHGGKVSVLNGGFEKWKGEKREVSREVPKIEAAVFRASIHADTLATKEYLLANLKKPGIFILDVRSPKEYSGEDRRSARGGHIPGAMNVDWTNNLLPGTGLFKPAKALREVYEAAGVSRNKEVIVYCQSGMRASHTHFALRLLGYPRVRVYDGSWQEWGNDPALPIERSF
jgi:thiosulfate/3-mercaptopyruvate sulfurtransferase